MSHTSQELAEQRRQKTKEKNARYYQANKESSRRASIARSKAHALETTARRIQCHTTEELFKIIHLCCQDRHVDIVAEHDAIARVLQLLHGPTNVLKPAECTSILSQSTAPSSSDPSDTKYHD